MRQSRKGRAPPRAPEVAVGTLRTVVVTRTYLALAHQSQFRPRTMMAAMGGVRIQRRSPCPPELYRRLYRAVGEKWFWHDRLDWTDEQLTAHLTDPNIDVWVVGTDDEPMGFFELKRDDDGGMEIAYFGLLPEFIGFGLGGQMLNTAVEEAWAMGAPRVWLHTCTLDSDHALPNYLARGFRPYKTEQLEVVIDGQSVVSERLLR